MINFYRWLLLLLYLVIMPGVDVLFSVENSYYGRIY